jgi:hypothetical protein
MPTERSHGGSSHLHPRQEAPRGPEKRLLRASVYRYDADSALYAYFKKVIAAYTIDSDIVILNYLYLYFYNLYFSIIVYKLANKTVQQYQQAERYQLYLTAIKATFIVYSLLVTAALVYRIIKMQIRCNGKSEVT